MEFKTIEKYVPIEVKEYIKNYCFEKKFVRSEITEVAKTETSTNYRSVYIYENVLNEEQYKTLVRDYYLTNIATEQQTEKKKRESGKNITLKEFFEIVFRNHFEFRRGSKDNKGRRIYLKSFLFNIDAVRKTINDKKVVRSLEKMQKTASRYGYFTPNMFISHQFFTKEMLSLMGVVVLDFDLNKVHKVMTKEEVKQYIQKKLNITPNIIWDTKTPGNYQVAILIEKMPATLLSVHLYEQIVKEMIHKLGDVVDEACYPANHIFSKPMNNKAKRRFIRLYSRDVHNINEFRWLLNERDERRKKERKVIDFKEMNFMKEAAIEALFNGQVSWRNHACFTLALVMRWLGKEQEETENFVLGDWIYKVNSSEHNHRFTTSEALHCIKHAYSGKYKCFHSKWIEIVTGIECNLTGYFRWIQYENKGVYKMDTKECLIKFFKKHGGEWRGTKKELVEELHVAPRTLDRVMAQMKEDNELMYVTERGRGAKTSFVLVDQLEFERMLEVSFDGIDYEISNINELVEEIESLHA